MLQKSFFLKYIFICGEKMVIARDLLIFFDINLTYQFIKLEYFISHYDFYADKDIKK